MMKEASLLFCLPNNPFFLAKSPSCHAVQEATYACSSPLLFPFLVIKTDAVLDCLWIFAQHFCNRLGPSYLQLKNVLDENNTTHAEILGDIKRRFRDETYTRESIAQIIHNYPELVRVDAEHLFIKLLISSHRSSCSMSILPPSITPPLTTHNLCTFSVFCQILLFTFDL